MRNEPIVSLCIPTNGVIQWVFPVLDSIYAQGVDPKLYEVVVMDNGQNGEFKQLMREYAAGRENLVYRETDAYEFMSEIETYKAASGKFIKFINHRTKLLPGTLMTFIQFVLENEATKPVIYFGNNGIPTLPQAVVKLDSFDGFVKELSYVSSWSTGMAFWKSSFESIPDLTKANELFPHTLILFSDRTNREYIIDNRFLLDEIPVGKIPKGRYNLFNAFAVEYPSIILDLYLSKDISKETFLSVKKDNLGFVRKLWFDYIFRKSPCSYDLSGYKESVSCFYSLFQVRMGLFTCGKKYLWEKISTWLIGIPFLRKTVRKIKRMLFPERYV